jgi:O-antigen/teichoic acid export membrane protein
VVRAGSHTGQARSGNWQLIMVNRLIKDTLIYLPSKLLPALTAFVTIPIVTRLLTPAEFGDYALAIGAADFLFALTCSGLGAGAVRFYTVYREQNRLRAYFVTLGLLLFVTIVGGGSLAVALLVAGSDRLPADLQSLLLISVLIFGVQATFIVLMQVVRAQERSKLYTTFDLAANYGSLILGLVLLGVFGWGASGLLWGAFIAYAAVLVMLVPAAMKRAGLAGTERTHMSDLQVVWRYAWPLAVGNVAMWGLRLSDRYLIGVFCSRADVGLYSAAYNISSKSIDILVAVLLLSIGPLIINTWERAGVNETRQAVKATTRLFLLVCLPVALGLSVLAAPFVMLLTDAPYHAGYQIVPFVVFSSFLYGLAQIGGIGLLIAQRTRRVAVNQIAAAVVNVTLNVILIPRFGFVAAGVTTLIGYLAFFALQMLTSRRFLAWPIPYRTVRNAIVASAASSLAAVGIYSLLNPGDSASVLSVSISVLTAILVYAAALRLTGEVSPGERAVIRLGLGRIVDRLKSSPEGQQTESRSKTPSSVG